MMDFVINGEELSVMCGLSHIQQLAYLRGIRPYMDLQTGITGVKRRISYQSIAEQLYVEPHQGVKAQSYSRDQIRRAVYGLVRAGLLEVQSDGMQLILKCPLASLDYSVQNKAAINPPQNAAIKPHEKTLVNTGFFEGEDEKAAIVEPPKAAIPLIKDNNYIYLLRQFDHFWRMYPEKKSRERAFEVFQQINPDEHLLHTMLQALDSQIKARQAKEAQGEWVPAWKFPANWLSQRCWEDEVRIELKPEKRNEKRRTHTATTYDPFWNEDTGDLASTGEDECQQTNIVSLQRYRKAD